MKELIDKMTVDEKSSLLSGKDNWHTKEVKRLNIPSIMMTDGPHGIRKMDDGDFGLVSSNKATCFPTASMVACSWDTSLVEEMSKAIAIEAKANHISIVLGPGANIKRSPLCGRNFEYFSEDQVLSGKMAGNFIKGMNEENVGCSLKHFACNNQEYMRMIASSNVDERALMDLYIKSFKNAIDIAMPSTVMCAYNKINDEYCSENKKLLTDILREKLGFTGAVISDWGAVDNRVKGVKAGLDLEMPSCNAINDKKVAKAVKNGELSEEYLDKAVENILKLVEKYSYINNCNVSFDSKNHYDLAVKIAENSAVLLKNDEQILPINPQEKVLLVGDMAKNSRYQGGGSSHITPFFVTSLFDGLTNNNVKFDFCQGYHKDQNKNNDSLIAKVCKIAKNYDKIIVTVGLTENMEVEGLDRKNLALPKTHNMLVESLTKVNKNVVVVNFSGSPVEMPWKNNVKGILQMYLAGSGSGEACANLLTAKAVPSGKLAETFPEKLSDVNSFSNFYFDKYDSYYTDSIFVGYKYYDATKTKVAFPFGYGLSYTNFDISDICLDNEKLCKEKPINISFNIKNTGNFDGKQVVQLYVGKKDSVFLRPIKELKNFAKISVGKGKEKVANIPLKFEDLQIYDINLGKYVVEKGCYQLYVATDVTNILKTFDIVVESEDKYTCDTQELKNYLPQNNQNDLAEFEKIYGNIKQKDVKIPKKGEYTELHSFDDFSKDSKLAKFVVFVVRNGIPIVTGEKKNSSSYMMTYEIFKYTPLFKLSATSQGAFTKEMVDGLLIMVNGKFFKGLKAMLKGLPKKNK